MTIPISEFFRVTTKIEVGGVTALDYGRGLVLTTDDSISAGGPNKSQYFTDLEGVVAVFGSDSEPGKAAAKWFGYDPYPQGLYIGRWAHENVPSSLLGGTPGALTSLTANNATFRVSGVDVTIDLSTQATFTAVASAIQNELTTGALTGAVDPDGVTITAPGSGFDASDTITFSDAPDGGRTATGTIVIGSGGAAGTVIGITITDPGAGYITAPTITFNEETGSGATATITLETTAVTPELAGSTFVFANNRFELELGGAIELDPQYFESTGDGTDISAALGMDLNSEPTYVQGKDAESPAEAVADIVLSASDRPIYLALDEGCPATYGADNVSVESMWTFAEAGQYIFGASDTTALARTSGETTSDAARAESSQLGNTLMCVADSDRQPHISALAALSSINWDQPASIITLFGKTMPGVGATRISETELGNIQAKRGNVYTRVGGLPTFVEGMTSRAGYWADAVAFSHWLKNEVELSIWNAARASRRLTIAILRASLDDSMRKAVRNGGIQPGRTVSNVTKADIIATTGNLDFDGVLQAGYLIHIGRLSEQTSVDIENRMAPPIKVWASGSEAIHRANVDIILSS